MKEPVVGKRTRARASEILDRIGVVIDKNGVHIPPNVCRVSDFVNIARLVVAIREDEPDVTLFGNRVKDRKGVYGIVSRAITALDEAFPKDPVEVVVEENEEFSHLPESVRETIRTRIEKEYRETLSIKGDLSIEEKYNLAREIARKYEDHINRILNQALHEEVEKEKETA